MEENKDLKTEIKETKRDEKSGPGVETEEIREEKNEAAETEALSKEKADGKKAARSMVSTRNGLYLRTVIGGLILYYAYTILSDMGTASGTAKTMLYVFVAVFGIAGIWIVLDSLKRILKKEYDE